MYTANRRYKVVIVAHRWCICHLCHSIIMLLIRRSIEPSVTTLQHCIEAFSEPETLTDSDAWLVVGCYTHE